MARGADRLPPGLVEQRLIFGAGINLGDTLHLVRARPGRVNREVPGVGWRRFLSLGIQVVLGTPGRHAVERAGDLVRDGGLETGVLDRFSSSPSAARAESFMVPKQLHQAVDPRIKRLQRCSGDVVPIRRSQRVAPA